jgi:SAM-dependent methyltransferase
MTNAAAKSALDFLLQRMPTESRRSILLRLLGYCGRKLETEASSRRLSSAQERQVLEHYAKLLDILSGSPNELRENLKFLLELDNKLYRLISAGAQTYDNGIHPKHRMIGYHDFFCRNIGADETVLDIGCGNGFLASDIAKCTTGKVIGIDKSAANIEFAEAHYQSENLQFVLGDVTADVELANCDVVVLSNVLEHLSERVQFLRRVGESVNPKTFLLRVPLKEELGLDFHLDSDHKVEYTQEQFIQEIDAAGLAVEHLEFRWGEIWCRAKGAPS